MTRFAWFASLGLIVTAAPLAGANVCNEFVMHAVYQAGLVPFSVGGCVEEAAVLPAASVVRATWFHDHGGIQGLSAEARLGPFSVALPLAEFSYVEGVQPRVGYETETFRIPADLRGDLVATLFLDGQAIESFAARVV